MRRSYPSFSRRFPIVDSSSSSREGSRATLNTTITFSPALFGQQVHLRDGATFASLQSHTASAVPWTLALQSGTYVIERAVAPDAPMVVRPGVPTSMQLGS